MVRTLRVRQTHGCKRELGACQARRTALIGDMRMSHHAHCVAMRSELQHFKRLQATSCTHKDFLGSADPEARSIGHESPSSGFQTTSLQVRNMCTDLHSFKISAENCFPARGSGHWGPVQIIQIQPAQKQQKIKYVKMATWLQTRARTRFCFKKCRRLALPTRSIQTWQACSAMSMPRPSTRHLTSTQNHFLL